MIGVFEISALLAPPSKLAEFASFSAAERYLRRKVEVVHFERDADYPNCADAIASNALIYMIQPTDFRL